MKDEGRTPGTRLDAALLGLLARLVARGARIVEVPVRHLPREHGKSSGGNPRVIARAFKDLFKLYGKLRRA